MLLSLKHIRNKVQGDSKRWTQLNRKRRLYSKFSARSTGWLAWATLKTLLNSSHVLLWYMWSAGAFAFTQTAYLLNLVIPTTNALPRWWVEFWSEDETHTAQQLPNQFELMNAKNLALHSSHFALNLMLLHGWALDKCSCVGIWTSSFKCYVDHSHNIYSSGNIDYEIESIFLNHAVLILMLHCFVVGLKPVTVLTGLSWLNKKYDSLYSSPHFTLPGVLTYLRYWLAIRWQSWTRYCHHATWGALGCTGRTVWAWPRWTHN